MCRMFSLSPPLLQYPEVKVYCLVVCVSVSRPLAILRWCLLLRGSGSMLDHMWTIECLFYAWTSTCSDQSFRYRFWVSASCLLCLSHRLLAQVKSEFQRRTFCMWVFLLLCGSEYVDFGWLKQKNALCTFGIYCTRLLYPALRHTH